MPLFPNSKSRVEMKVYFVQIKARNGSDALQLKHEVEVDGKAEQKGRDQYAKASSQVRCHVLHGSTLIHYLLYFYLRYTPR
jgi:hypothetical protein